MRFLVFIAPVTVYLVLITLWYMRGQIVHQRRDIESLRRALEHCTDVLREVTKNEERIRAHLAATQPKVPPEEWEAYDPPREDDDLIAVESLDGTVMYFRHPSTEAR